MTKDNKRHNIQKVLSGGRISLPQDFVRRWDLEVGDFVIVREGEDGVEFFPAEITQKTTGNEDI